MQGDRGHSVEGVPDSQFLVLAVATNTTCAIAPGGYVDCWGSNYQGQADIEGEGPFEELVAGGQNFCGIRADRTARCWGYNAWEGDERAWKMLGIDEVLCGIQVGTETVECFENRDGEAREAPDGTFEQVSVGRLFACGVTTDRAVECWRAEEGPVQAPFPAKNHDLVSVSVGYDHACALRSSGTLYCWGVNDKGQTDAP